MNRASHGIFSAAVGRMFALLATRVQKGLERRRSARRLRLSETLSLGEKRFLAVVQFQKQEFLVGGTGNSIALLARLDAPEVAPDSHAEVQEARF
jgi:flagellar biogenesis protein FliO